jgi:hypothetical protein
MVIGIMVALLLAGLGYLWWRSQHMGGAPAPAGVSDGQSTNYGGIDFVTTQSKEATDAAAGGAYSYDVNNPQVQQARADALKRAETLTEIAGRQGLTADQLYQQHLQQDVLVGQQQVAAINARAVSAGAAPATSNADLYRVMQYSGPPPAGAPPAAPVAGAPPAQSSTQPPGTYWDYASATWQPLIF